MKADSAPKDSLGTKVALALILSVCFFFGSYITSTVISEALGRRGLPGSPLIYAVVILPLVLLIVVFEQRVQDSKYWAKIGKFWYVGIAAVGSGIPIILTIVAPLLFWQSLPRGGAIGVAFVAMVVVGLGVLVSGIYARRRNNL